MPLGIIQTKGDVDPPGTEFLLDTEQTSTYHPYEHTHLKHGSGKYANVVLVPQPSNDPNDPLLWPRWKKELAFITIFVNVIIFATVPGPLLASSSFALAGILHVELGKISELSGYQLLVVGAFGPIVSVLAQKYGKRPQFLFATLMGVIGTAVCLAAQSSYNLLLAGRIIQGFGVTAFESLSLAAIGDMFYIHERGWRTAMLVLTLACMASLGSIISGVITERQGWRTLFIILLPFDIAGVISVVFFLPETQFNRVLTSRSEDEDLDKMKTESSHLEVTPQITIDSTKQRKTFIQSLAIFSGRYSEKNLFRMVLEIFVHLFNPAVLWILTISAVLVSLFAATAYISAQIWSVPPYNLNTAQNGYFFTGAFVGGVVGVSAGWMCDVSARVMARANKGTFEPEFRIPINILAALILGIGWFVWMWDVNHPTPHGYYLGAVCHGMICFGITVTSTSGGLYILDAFRVHSTEIFILQMMTKNFLFYAFATFINSWTAIEGAGRVFEVFGIVSLTLLASCIPMYVLGKLNRKYVHDLWNKFVSADE